MSLVGPVTDYLFGLAQGAVAGVTVGSRPAVAVDGPIDDLEPGMFVVGQSAPPTDGEAATNVAYSVLTIGGLQVDALGDVPCYIDVRIAGQSLKPARDAAEAMFSVFFEAWRADLSLGGLLHGPASSLTAVTWTPTLVGTAAEPGRRMHVAFSVTFQTLVT